MGRRRSKKGTKKRLAEESTFSTNQDDSSQIKKCKVEDVETPSVDVDLKLREIYHNENSSLQQQKEFGDSFVRYLPPVYSTTMESLKTVLPRKEKLFRYELFPECIYPPEKKVFGQKIAELIQLNVTDLLAERFSEKEQNLRITITGRSGDGKTFLLYYLANKCNDSCIFIPIHTSIADYFAKLSSNEQLLVHSDALLCSYLTYLQEILESGTTNPYKIMELFNNRYSVQVTERSRTYVDLSSSFSVRSEVKKISNKYRKYPVFVIDEAHKMAESHCKECGSALTALTRSAGPIPVICCSTKIGGVNLGIDTSGIENFSPYNLLQDVDEPKQNFSSTDFISFFINPFESMNEVKQLTNTLLSDCPVRILTMIMDEYWIVKGNNLESGASNTSNLKKAIKGVFRYQMPSLGKKMKEYLESIGHERLKKLLFFAWTALNPNIEQNCDLDITKLDWGVQELSLIPQDIASEYGSFSQHMLHLGCGKPKDGIYRFSDAFFRFAYFESMREETWHTYATYLGSCMKNVDQSHVRKKGFLFERVIGLLFLVISKVLHGKPITQCRLFEGAKGTWLDNYTISIRSVEMTSKFSESLIFFETTDIIACPIDENSSCDLFFSLVPINKEVDTKFVPCLTSIIFQNAILEEDIIFRSTMIENQKSIVIPITELMNRSNHHSERRLRIGFVANSILGHDVKIANGDIQILLSLNHHLLFGYMKEYLGNLLEELMNFTTIIHP